MKEFKNDKRLLSRIIELEAVNSYVIGSLFFLTALLVRMIFYYLNTDLIFGGLSAKGVPFSDAQDWDILAENLSQGNGLTGVGIARRPFYPVLLAMFYTWFGPSFFLAKLINIILNALSVAYIYLVCEKAFNRCIGIFAGLAALFSLNHLIYSITVLTEPAGLFFFAASLYYLVSGLENQNPWRLFISGVLFSLSNLTRTLTILCFPGYVLCIVYLLYRNRMDWNKIVRYAVIYSIGVILCLAPWLIRQKLTFGIFSISENVAESFYAATSPTHKTWSGLVDLEAKEKGIQNISERYDFYMNKAYENLRNNPYFFIQNAANTFFGFINALNIKDTILINFTSVFLLIMLLSNVCMSGQRIHILYFIGLTASVLIIQRLIPLQYAYLIIISGIFIAAAGAFKYVIIFINSILFTGIGFAVVGGGPLERVFLLMEWIFQSIYFITFYYPLNFVFQKIVQKYQSSDCIETSGLTSGKESVSETYIKLFTKALSYAAVLFFIISGVKLIYLNYFHYPQKGSGLSELSSEQKNDIMEAVKTVLPKVFDENELNNPDIFRHPVQFSDDDKNHGKIIIEQGRITRYVYPLEKDEGSYYWFRVFHPRRYARTLLDIKNVGYVMLPGDIPKSFIGRKFIFIGRLNVDKREIYQGRIIAEGIGLIPVMNDNGDYDLKDIMCIENEAHLNLLLSLKIKKS